MSDISVTINSTAAPISVGTITVGNVGDMQKATYDTDGDGVVDNAEKVNDHSVEKDVPSDAVFTDTTYSNATTEADGLMSSEDKTKLDGVDEGADNTTIINDLTTGGTTDALSAEQGKTLKGYVDTLNGYDITPIATYTHSGNLEVVISAVDVDTDTFTSVGHGLSVGNQIYPILNSDAGLLYPPAVFAGGIDSGNVYGYYIIADGFSNDTFKISLTNGGSAVNLTTNATIDLTKWHFERSTVNAGFSISGLSAAKKYKLRCRGRSLYRVSSVYILPNGIAVAANWINPYSGSYYYPVCNSGGDVWNDFEVVIDFSGFLNIISRGLKCVSNTTSSNTVYILNLNMTTFDYSETDITSISFSSINPANGFCVEVYNA